MDIEGAEQDAIIGAMQTIKKYKPKLAISIYYKNEDLWKIARLIKDINPSYKLWLRYYGGETYPSEYVLFAL